MSQIGLKEDQTLALLDEWPFDRVRARAGKTAALALIAQFGPVFIKKSEFFLPRAKGLVAIWVRGKGVLLDKQGNDGSFIFKDSILRRLKQLGLVATRVTTYLELIGSPLKEDRHEGAVATEQSLLLVIDEGEFYDKLAEHIYSRDLPYHLKELRAKHQMLSYISYKAIKNVFEGCQPKRYSKGEEVVEVGQRPDIFVLVLRGELGVMSGGSVLLTLGPGQLYGLEELLLDRPHEHDVASLSHKSYIIYGQGSQLKTLILATRTMDSLVQCLKSKILWRRSLVRLERQQRKSTSSARKSPRQEHSQRERTEPEVFGLFDFFKQKHRKYRAKSEAQEGRQRYKSQRGNAGVMNLLNRISSGRFMYSEARDESQDRQRARLTGAVKNFKRRIKWSKQAEEPLPGR